jgi:hypothetical protein
MALLDRASMHPCLPATAGVGMPWEALEGDLEPSVRVALMRAEGGHLFAGMCGAASADQVAEALWGADAGMLAVQPSWQERVLLWRHPDPEV